MDLDLLISGSILCCSFARGSCVMADELMSPIWWFHLMFSFFNWITSLLQNSIARPCVLSIICMEVIILSFFWFFLVSLLISWDCLASISLRAVDSDLRTSYEYLSSFNKASVFSFLGFMSCISLISFVSKSFQSVICDTIFRLKSSRLSSLFTRWRFAASSTTYSDTDSNLFSCQTFFTSSFNVSVLFPSLAAVATTSQISTTKKNMLIFLICLCRFWILIQKLCRKTWFKVVICTVGQRSYFKINLWSKSCQLFYKMHCSQPFSYQ